MTNVPELKASAAVTSLKGTKHTLNEDRYRLLGQSVPLVKQLGRGEIFGVFDGIGSAPKGRQAAQEMADVLLKFYQEPEIYESSQTGIQKLLLEGNEAIFGWGFMPGRNDSAPLGGCAGTVVWIYEGILYSFHAGDTVGLLIRDGKSEQITHDHQTPDGAIYRYFGLGVNLEIERDLFTLEELDRILLLSDGVTKIFHPEEAAALVENYDDISVGARELANRSQRRGSSDDITVMVIEVEEPWD